jgi:transcriptional regulator with XRE-family HTH domain
MTLRDRVEAAYARAGMRSRSELARACEVAPSSITQMLSGEFPGTELLNKIAEKTGVSYEWLRFGDETKAPDWARTVRNSVAEIDAHYNPNPIPMVGTVVAGDGQRSDQSAYEHNGADNLMIPDSWRAVMVEGMSAYPVVYPGQIVLIDTNRAARPDSSTWGEQEMTDLHDNLVLVETDEPPEIGKATSGRRAYLKRFCMDKRSPDGFLLASIDSGRSSPYVPPASILMIVPVVGVLYQDPRRPREKRWHAKTVVATIRP